MKRLAPTGVWSAVAAGYAALACLLTWPLPLHLRTHLLGDPAGDTGVYVWNMWIFRHELIEHWHLPFSTDHVFAYTGGADFSLHNYTPIADVLGVPLVGALGVVGAFNAVLLALVVLSGVGTFLLARRSGLGAPAAWCAGAVFIASPVLNAKETAHFSLVIAFALPLFLWALLRTLDTKRLRDAFSVGALVAVAIYSDVYYGVYCVLMGGFLVAWRFTRVTWRAASAPRPLTRFVELAAAATFSFFVWRVFSGTTRFSLGWITIGTQTLYTPVLVLTGLVAWRTWLAWRPVPTLHDPECDLRDLLRLGFAALSSCVLLLLPMLAGFALRIASNRFPGTEIYWRTSPRGIDLLSYFVPNPNHPWFGDHTRGWLLPDWAGAFPEFVGSFSIVAFFVIAVAAVAGALPRFWVAFTAVFVWLSVGPFVHVGGVNTYVIGPWALLRYVPLVGLARSPSRFAVVAVLGLSLLFGFALQGLFRRDPRARTVQAGILLSALGLELCPVPRPLYSAAIPEVYRILSATHDETGRLLELPTGIRDGTSSLGDFSAAAQYAQTGHGRPLIGGYLSRVSSWRKAETQRAPMLRALFLLSEGRPLDPEWREPAYRSRDTFLRRSCVEWVIIHRHRVSKELRDFAIDALQLSLVYEDANDQLYTLARTPPCDASGGTTRSLKAFWRR
jgi:hypothetical protein